MHPTLNIAIKAARRAGQVISRASRDLGQIKVTTKQQSDYVTEIDKAAQPISFMAFRNTLFRSALRTRA